MKTILIGTSNFGSPVSDYFKELGKEFIENEYRIIFIFDGLVKKLPANTNQQLYFTWPSKRPTKIKDFVFLIKIIKKYQPILCLSNFSSTNVISIVSFLFKVKYRINYIHTTSKAIENDSQNILRTRLLRYRKIIVLKLNNYFFTNSEGTKRDAISTYFLNKKHTYVFPLLIKDNDSSNIPLINRKFNLLIVGGLTPTKGHKQLFYQLSNCLEKYPNLKLQVIGSGILKQNLINLTKELKIDNNIEFIGNLPNHEVQSYFANAIISISSSLDEAYGLVNIEALRAGTPLVCTKTAGSLDILKEGFNGEYFDHKNEHSLCESISKVIENWEQYSENSLRTFKNYYSMDSKIQQHKNKIIELL